MATGDDAEEPAESMKGVEIFRPDGGDIDQNLGRDVDIDQDLGRDVGAWTSAAGG
ncbi:hypothetical protein LRS74_21285 [Streptomyces sp. LX-29]|uniref:hypothetical protein n=1 Tax=Streptomyces sp. LX-29 TaxID=2900152 RepID=UPI00240D9AA4|nr:hypothetical protein [Streptomyces sp. LX-29]WFB09288.1 hypothetical protein LRS74_21285 [Streptomyces sp. LX-29]